MNLPPFPGRIGCTEFGGYKKKQAFLLPEIAAGEPIKGQSTELVVVTVA